MDGTPPYVPKMVLKEGRAGSRASALYLLVRLI